MQSHGKAGHVMISETTKKILMREEIKEWDYIYETEVEIKNMITSISGYLVQGNENKNEDE